MVELGGHGSSPDVDPYNVFQPGVDVNVHSSDAWGTRDQLALTGNGYIGPYRSEYTLARTEGGVRLFPPTQLYQDSTKYALIPMGLLARLDTAIAQRPDSVLALIEELDTLLLPSFDSFDPDDFDTDAGADRLVSLLQAWRLDLCCGVTGNVEVSHHQMWQHSHYRGSPTNILKSHLYRASWGQIGAEPALVFDQLVLGGLAGSSGMRGWSLGFVMPTSSIFGLYIPGVLTLELGQSREFAIDVARKGWYAGATVDESFRDLYGWYGALRFHSRRLDRSLCDEGSLCTELRRSVALSFGGSILIWNLEDARRINVFRRLRVRAGVAFPMRWGRDAEAPSFEVQIVLH